VFSVRKNLYDALTHMRSDTESRVLWIDALCIDQSDGQERNHQVQLMGDIYHSARQVIVWLGVAAEDSDLAMNLKTKVRDFKIPTMEEILEIVEIEALVKLWNRSYWYRVWIRQEIQLAQIYTVYCGSKFLTEKDMDILFALVGSWPTGRDRYMNEHSERLAVLFKQLDRGIVKEHIFLRHMPNSMTSLHRLISSSLQLNCVSSEPRDYVYAFLGLASDCKSGELLCDYQKPLVEIYLDAIRVICLPQPWQRSVSWVRVADDLANRMGIVVDDSLQRLRFEAVSESRASSEKAPTE